MRFHIESYGCTMNHGEAEILRRRLLSGGHMLTTQEKAELNILFTCVVIQQTERRMLKRIKALAELGHPILISGCLVTTFPEKARDIVPNALPNPSGLSRTSSSNATQHFVLHGSTGIRNYVPHALSAFGQPALGNQRFPRALMIPPSRLSELGVEELEIWVREGKEPKLGKGEKIFPIDELFCADIPEPLERTTFIVPISQGCLGNCTYCITKIARGQLDSYPIEEIADMVKAAVENGYREIQLTSQDTSIYGRDRGKSLPELLEKLCGISGDFRIRVGMMNPAGPGPIPRRLIRAYSSKKVFKFLHLPVQSGDNSIIRAMKRGYTLEDFKKIVKEFRAAFPELTLSTDIIVGFPGEDEAAFQRSVQLIEEIRPDLINITRYSERPGTEAAALPGKVHGGISKERSRVLTKLRFKISAEINSGFVGKEMRVLVTRKGRPGSVICRDDDYRTVVITKDLPVGEWHRVRIVDATEVYLKGEIV